MSKRVPIPDEPPQMSRDTAEVTHLVQKLGQDTKTLSHKEHAQPKKDNFHSFTNNIIINEDEKSNNQNVKYAPNTKFCP